MLHLLFVGLHHDGLKIVLKETNLALAMITTCVYFTFFLNSGLPFLTVATIMSPDPAAGSLFNRPLIPWTAITYRFLAPGIACKQNYINYITLVSRRSRQRPHLCFYTILFLLPNNFLIRSIWNFCSGTYLLD